MDNDIFILGFIFMFSPIPPILYLFLCLFSFLLLAIGSKYNYKECIKNKKINISLIFLIICWISFLLCIGYSIDRILNLFSISGKEINKSDKNSDNDVQKTDPLHVIALISCILFFILYIVGTNMFYKYNKSNLYKILYVFFSFFFIVLFILCSFVSSSIIYSLKLLKG